MCHIHYVSFFSCYKIYDVCYGQLYLKNLGSIHQGTLAFFFLNLLLPRVNIISGRKEFNVIGDVSFSNFFTHIPPPEIKFLLSCQALPTLFQ